MKITKAEMELMRILWSFDTPLTSSRLLELLPPSNNWKPTTVLTFLSRLAEKGMVQIEKRGKSNWYRPAVTEMEYRARETSSFLEDMHGGSVKNFIASLYDVNGLSTDELDELRQWLAER